jgi:hypothetical protein
MRALTVRQLWAWAIIHAGKDIENRSWTNKHATGTIAVHAGSGLDPLNIEEFVGPDSDLVEFREQSKLCQLLDGVWQCVDADTELAHRIGLLENLAVDATRLQHEGRGEPANATANDNRLHSHTRR